MVATAKVADNKRLQLWSQQIVGIGPRCGLLKSGFVYSSQLPVSLSIICVSFVY